MISSLPGKASRTLVDILRLAERFNIRSRRPNISSLLPFPEEGKGIQKAHRDGLSFEGIEIRLWLEPTELQSVPGNSDEIHPEILELKFEISEFRRYIMGSTELGSRDIRERLENCEDYIDVMYDKLFETPPLNKEIPSPPPEYEEWLDKKFDKTVTNSFLTDIREETKKQEHSSTAGTEQMSASQISSNKQ